MSEDDLKGKKKKKRKKVRRRIYAVLIAVSILLLGAGTVVGAMFFQNVETPDDTPYGENTTFYYAGYEGEVGGYGDEFRILVDDYDELPDTVIWAMLASEDKKFFEHDGVDMKGTFRAFINNVTGGEQQGASTISQQYAGALADFRDDISYGRKAQEAVMAMKLEKEYGKKEILRHYLNIAPFGRGAIGIGAASQAYFDKDYQELTWEEAAFIVMQVKAPSGTYDPKLKDEDGTVSAERWQYVMDNLWEIRDDSGITKEEYENAEVPETVEIEGHGPTWGGDSPTGFITNEVDGYVFDELEEHYGLTKSDLYGGENGPGGYDISLTLDPEIQKLTEETASRGDLIKKKNEDDEWIGFDGEVVDSKAAAAPKYFESDKLTFNDEPLEMPRFENDNEKAALYDRHPSMADAVVVVEPGTGRVLGYYGGDDGMGIDRAGIEGAQPPSSSFKMITASLAILNESSIDSWWDGSSPREFEGRTEDDPAGPVHNAGDDEPDRDLTLQNAVKWSLNTPMYAIADEFGATNLLKVAIDMGVEHMERPVKAAWEDGQDITATFEFSEDGTQYALRGEAKTADGEWSLTDNETIDSMAYLEWADPDNSNAGVYATDDGEPVWYDLDMSRQKFPFDREIAFGQYGVSVRDMSAVFATLAADGEYNETHYVEEVRDRDGNVVKPIDDYRKDQVLDPGIAQDLQEVGSEIGGAGGNIGRPKTGKTGTWEAHDDFGSDANAHAWYAGAIPQLSIAAWVGNVGSDVFPMLNKDGWAMGSSYGSELAQPVWYDLMTKVIDAKSYEVVDWKQAPRVGDVTAFDIENEDGTIDADSPYCRTEQGSQDERCVSEDDDDDECSAVDEFFDQCDEDGENEGEEGDGPGNGNGPGEEDGGNEEEDCGFLCDGDGDGGQGGGEDDLPGGGEDNRQDGPGVFDETEPRSSRELLNN